MSILLSCYDQEISPEEIGNRVPQIKDKAGNNRGTINTQLATWGLSLGFDVSLYTFDCQIIDQSWSELNPQRIIERLEADKSGIDVPSLGSIWSDPYRQSYIDFIKAGGKLHIQPSVSSKLLHGLLAEGPILPCLCFNTLYGAGRSRNEGAHDSMDDDVNGLAMNHSVVIYGNDSAGNFLIADPWKKPGLQTVEPERMLCAISTAQIECDNLVFQLTPKNKNF